MMLKFIVSLVLALLSAGDLADDYDEESGMFYAAELSFFYKFEISKISKSFGKRRERCQVTSCTLFSF